MSRPRTRFAALLLTTALISPAALAAEAKYPATVDVFGGVSNDGPGGGLELIAPFVEGESSLLFGLARGVMGDETGAGGLGLGYRTQALPGFILGGYGMLDYQRGQSDEGYFQGVLGLEALTESFDLRVNGYLPEDDETTLADVTGASPALPPVTVGELAIVGHEIGLVTSVTAGAAGVFRSFERPMPGIDAEIGYRLPVPGHDFRIFLGAFHFDHEDYESVTGPKARAEWRIHDLDLFGSNSRLTLEAGIRDDEVRGTDASAGVRIRIPFGGVPSNQRGHELAGLDRRMLDPIRREDHIVTGEREEAQAGTSSTVELEAVEAVETGNEITSIWFADGAGGGDGTMGNETTLGNAVAGAGAGGLVVALGGSGNLAGNITLADDQILLGGASTLEVQGVTSGTTATYAPGGARPTLLDDGTAATAVVQLADGNIIAGFDTRSIGINILGNGVDGLIARDIGTGGDGNGMAIIGGTNLDVTNFSYRRSAPQSTGFGLRLVNVATATLDQLMFENTGNGAWIVSSSDIDISNVDSTNNAIAVNLVSSSDVTIDEVTASYSLPITVAFPISAVAVSRDGTVPSNIDISDVTFTATAPFATMRAIDIFNAADISVTRLNATNVHTGVVLNTTQNATLTDLTVTNALGAAASLLAASDVTLNGLDGSNVTVGLFTQGATNVTVTDVDLTQVASSGASINNTTGLTVTDFTAVGLGTAPGSTRTGIQLQTSSNASFTDVDVSQFHRGIMANGGLNHDFTNVTLDFVNAGALVNGVNGFAMTNATMSDVQIGMTVASGGGSVSRNVELTDVNITGRAGIVGVSPGIQMLGVDGATLTRITVEDLAWGVRFFGSLSSVVQNVTASDITVTNFSQSALQTVDASSITVDGFTISNGVGDGIQIIQASNNVTFSNGSISDVAGMGIRITGTGAMGAALSNIDISGISTRAGVFHSGAGVSLENSVVASFNQIDIDGMDSSGASVGVYGFDFIDQLGNTQTVSGTGNTAVNVTNVCGRNGLGTVSGTVQVNGNPEPGTSC